MTFLKPTPDNDPFLHLEETTEETLAWVTERSENTLNHFAGDHFDTFYEETYEIFSAKDKLITATKRGDYVYNFYTDGEHPRGLWRRASWEAYLAYTSAETEPNWEILLDIGKLNEEEGSSWVFHGASLLYPTYDRALVSLSPGGSDSDITREFDLTTKSFVEDGFFKPESKGDISWIDRDTVLVSSDHDGELTNSGYPIKVGVIKRGEKVQDARTLLLAETHDMLVGAGYDHTPGFEKTIAYIAKDFRTFVYYDVNVETGELTKLKIPHSAGFGSVRDRAVLTLREDWQLETTTFKQGSLLVLPYEKALCGPTTADVQIVFEPTEASSLLDMAPSKTGFMFSTLDKVRTRLFYAAETEGKWKAEELHPEMGDFNNIFFSAVEAEVSDDFWLTTNGFLTPTTLSMGSFDNGFTAEKFTLEEVRSSPERFKADGLEARQRWVTSDDGTKVPYFVVGQPEALDGKEPAPTLLNGYGGFEIAEIPFYASTYGKTLLERGYVFALANIRGGGEFGPRWHQAALKEKRHKAYEDFAAIARDLAQSGITTREMLVANGGSNGGLLMGNMYTRYPELFGGIICMVPLLDMKRFSHLLAGASWMDEYGNPDTDDWQFIKEFSAYHNLEEGEHPPILITTSTRDDRVHPGHARKFQALLEANGLNSYYYENTEGGHGGAADIEQSATVYALFFSFLKEVTDR